MATAGSEIRPSTFSKLKPLTRTIDADIICEAYINGCKVIVHIEFQRNVDGDMANRLWEYNVLATLANECPVYSFVIYLLPRTVPEPPLTWGLPGQRTVHTFDFTNIKLRELTVEAIRKEGLKGLLPLCLLTSDGRSHQVGDTILEELAICKEQGDKELLNLALGLASLVFTNDEDVEWLERKHEMLEELLKDTWYEQYLLKRGRKEGEELGIKKGQELGREEILRSVVQEIIQTRFPALVEFTAQQLDQIQDSERLRKLNSRLIIAQNQEEALQAFQNIGPKDQS